jgi:hypothetical protein
MNQHRPFRKSWSWAVAGLCLAVSGLAEAATDSTTPASGATKAPANAASASAAPRPTRPTYNSFTNIAAVNIFNPWRVRGRDNSPEGRSKPTILYERIAFTGTMDTRQEAVGLLRGTSRNTAGASGRHDREFKIIELTHHAVKLSWAKDMN